jgi:argininosuccinate synthase
VITLVITNSALKNTRIHDLAFSESGDVFSITAAPLISADSMQTISISFHQGSTVEQTDYVEIGPGKTVQEVYCPENFDQIVIDSSDY